MADIKTVTLSGNEVQVTVERRHCHIRNLGSEMIYASLKPGIVPDADGVLGIPAGAKDVLTDTDGHVYIKGTGKVQLVGSDYADGILGGLAGGDISAAVAAAVAKIVADAPEDFDTLKEISDWIYSHSDSAAEMNSAIQALKTDISDGVPANGGNADTVDSLHANEIASNPNSIINSDFRINQRGKELYEDTDSNVFCYDHWMLYSGWKVTYAPDDGILCTNYNPGLNGWIVSQTIENFELFRNKTVTFSADITTVGSSFQLLIYCGSDQHFSESLTVGVNQISYNIPSNATTLKAVVFQSAGGYENAQIGIRWAKLELGSVATPFIPPEPATELMKCQRYYVKEHTLGVINKVPTQASAQGVNLSFPVPMRMVPTTILTSASFVGYKGIDLTGADYVDNWSPNKAGFSILFRNDLLVNEIGMCGRFGYEADAEIY